MAVMTNAGRLRRGLRRTHVNDEATADLLTQRIQTHEKTAWMLRSAGLKPGALLTSAS